MENKRKILCKEWKDGGIKKDGQGKNGQGS